MSKIGAKVDSKCRRKLDMNKDAEIATQPERKCRAASTAIEITTQIGATKKTEG